jgi:hypothetical protein
MPEVIVELRNATEQGRLYYERDPETDRFFISIENPPQRQRMHCVNINGGNVILWFNNDRILQLVDLSCNWNNKVLHLEVPQVARVADVVLAGVEPEPGRPPYTRLGSDRVLRHHCDFDTVGNMITDTSHSCAQFLFGATEVAGEWIALSHQCFALVINNYLRGFFVRLANASLR